LESKKQSSASSAHKDQNLEAVSDSKVDKHYLGKKPQIPSPCKRNSNEKILFLDLGG
jgi:hypothetical protein